MNIKPSGGPRGNKCGHLYVGETGRRLGDRFREHRRNVINRNIDNEVSSHFLQDNHDGVENMVVRGLAFREGTWQRKLEEQRLIAKLGCVLGQGMNVDFRFPTLLD